MNFTTVDLELATLFYPSLVELGRRNETRSYKTFLTEVQALHPENETLARAVPLNVGRRLDVIRVFTRSKNYPDLGCLIVSGATGAPGTGYDGNVTLERERIAAFDWSSVVEEFSLEIQRQKRAMTKRPKRGRTEATRLMSDYYQQNRTSYDNRVFDRREDLIALLMKGEEVADAFEMAAGEFRKVPDGAAAA